MNYEIMATNPNIPSEIDLEFDISSTVLSPILSMMVLAGLSVALRMTSTYSSMVSLQIDDYLILAALVCDLCVVVATLMV